MHVEKNSELSTFLRLADDCCLEALGELGVPIGYLSAIDSLYIDFTVDGGGIKPATASILMLNAHASLRAAIGLSLSGQLLPVFSTLRGCVESALYANAAMVQDKKLQSIWLKRDVDDDCRKECRSKFTAANMFRLLTQAHTAEFSERFREVYDTTIDFGAHPNNRSLLSSTRIEELNTGEHELNFAFIHGAGSFELRQSLVACAEVGLAVFFVALICFSDHPKLDSLNQQALDLQKEIPDMIEQIQLLLFAISNIVLPPPGP